jgi:hypothetical protein
MNLLAGIASTTHIDAHGQRIARTALDEFARQIRVTYIPLLINHDFSQQIGVNLAARVIRLDDGEYAMLVVSGIFDDESEALQFPVGTENEVWADYSPVLDEMEATVPKLLASVTDIDDPEIAQPVTVSEELEFYLDSTEVAPDGSVYLIKRHIASVGSLKIYLCPKDHDPPHFHVESKQRNMNARFRVDTLEYYDMKHGQIRPKEVRQIQEYFRTHLDALDRLKEEYQRLR